MKRQLLIASMLTASTFTISVPVQADKFPYNNLPVDIVCLEEIPEPYDITILYKDFSCAQIMPTKDILACKNSGGQVGAIGTRPVCVNERVTNARPKVGIPPFWPDALAAKHFVPVTVPVELYNGQKDPRAGVGRPSPIEQIPVRTK